MVKVDMTHSITCQHCIDLIHVPEDIMFIRHSGRHKWIGKEIIYTYLKKLYIHIYALLDSCFHYMLPQEHYANHLDKLLNGTTHVWPFYCIKQNGISIHSVICFIT